jgi:DeoR/GlpR family transcriptional regulator of sugar metabolism
MGVNIHVLAEERHRVIRDRLAADGRVLATELASSFGVSEDTIRRDLRELARAGACRRVYGGAVPLAPAAAPPEVRATIAIAAKARLAAAAVRLLQQGQLVFIDAGTTNLAIARAIPPSLHVTVATNAVAVAAVIAAHPAADLILLGGPFDRSLGASVGPETVAAVDRLRADLVFLGACGVDPAAGVTAFSSAEAEVKRAMLRNAAGLVVAATTDKVGTAAPYRVAPAASITQLVVEEDAPEAVLSQFVAEGCIVQRA